MKISTFTAGVQEYDISLDTYIGKDFVHEGCLLKLDPNYSWERISAYTRRNINRAKKLTNVRIEQVKGTKENIKKFRTVWFNPKDTTLPDQLTSDEIMYFAYLDNALVAGVILTPAGGNLYLHNLGGNDTAKKNNINHLLLWHAVEDLQHSQYKYIDIGVSFRRSLYTFFTHWQTEKYPIIFNEPFIKPHITLAPFTNDDIVDYSSLGNTTNDSKILKDYFGDTYTILPRGIYAIKAIIKYLKIKKTENIAIYKTFNDNNYISRCVTETISQYCGFTREIDKKTRAVMVIHEFGYPYTDILKLKELCAKNNIPLIENCAWGYGSMIDPNYQMGKIGDYAIYSLTKILPMQYGAILTGVSIDDETNWNEYKLLDYYKRELIISSLMSNLSKLERQNTIKVKNWKYLAKLFINDGYPPLIKLEKKVYPTVLLIKVQNTDEMNSLYDRFLQFGIEIGKYYPENTIFVPIHQNLNKKQLNYIYGVFRGPLNLCFEYKRTD